MKSKYFTSNFLLLVISSVSIFCCQRDQKLILDISYIWKQDTCGMKDYRIRIAPLLVLYPEKVIGLSANEVIDYFGEPDFTEKDELSSPVKIEYIYSTSSLEMVDGKCGDPVVRSFALILDKNTMTVSEVREFIH